MIGKLVVDYEEISLGDLLESLTEKGIECCVDGDNIYVYSSEVDVGAPNLIIVKDKKIQNYFFKELISPPTHTPTNYVQTWLLEKFNQQEYLRFEEQHQAELKKAQDNIQNAMHEYQDLYEKYLKQEHENIQN